MARAKAQLVQVTMQRFESSTKLGAVAGKKDKSQEEMADVRSTCYCIERLVRSIVGKTVEALDAFVDQAGNQLVDRLLVELEGAYAVSRLAWSHKLTHVSGVGVPTVEV